MKIVVLLFIVLIAMVGYAFWKNLCTPVNIGVIDNKLSACPNSPNCVSSFGKDATHYIKPIKFQKENPLSLIKLIISENYEAIVQSESNNYLHAIFISPKMRYRDDVEFMVDEENLIIHVRSASRIGCGDMGANRKRIEQIRRFFNEVAQ